MSDVRIDPVDRQILDALRRDGRMPISELARLVNLSPAPVARRVQRLERTGVIRGYVALIDEQRSGTLEAFTEIRLQGATETGEIADLVKTVPEVEEFHTIAGDPDVLVRLRVEDVDHLQRVVNAIRRTGKVAGTKTLIVMYRWSRLGGDGQPADADASGRA